MVDRETIVRRAESRAALLKTWRAAWAWVCRTEMVRGPSACKVTWVHYAATESVVRDGLDALSPWRAPRGGMFCWQCGDHVPSWNGLCHACSVALYGIQRAAELFRRSAELFQEVAP